VHCLGWSAEQVCIYMYIDIDIYRVKDCPVYIYTLFTLCCLYISIHVHISRAYMYVHI